MRARELLLKIMAVLAKVSTLRERLPSVLVDPCLYYCCTAHQALAALCSLCTEGCARTVRSTCVGVRNVIREFIWTAATVLSRKFGQVFLTRTVDLHAHPRKKQACDCPVETDNWSPIRKQACASFDALHQTPPH